MISDDKLRILNEYQKELEVFVSTKNKVQRDYLRNCIVSKYKPLLGFTSRDIEQHAILTAEPESNDETKTSYTLKEIMELQNTIPDWIVPNLIRAGGGLWMLSGSPKAGKTLVGGYDLAVSVAVTGDFLGNPCTTGRVLFFQCEESDATLFRRFQDRGIDEYNDLQKEKLAHAIENDLIIVEKEFSLLNMASLKATLRRVKPTLVIFDSLRAISSQLETSENSSDFSRYIYTLQKTLMMEGVSGLLIHHNKKNAKAQGIEGVSGSLSIAGATDGIILLYKSESEEGSTGHFVEIQTVPRDGTPIHWVLRDTKDPTTGYKKFTKVKEFGVETKVIKVERRILRLLSKVAAKEDGTNLVAYEDICRELSEDPKSSVVKHAIERLSESSQIKQTRVQNEETGLIISMYSIPVSSPWTKLGDTVSGHYPEFTGAEDLLACTSKEEITALLDLWENNRGITFKKKVWAVLNELEKANVHKILEPPAFRENTWVRVKVDNSAEKVIECRFDVPTSTWTYIMEGKPDTPFKENEITLDLDYAVTESISNGDF